MWKNTDVKWLILGVVCCTMLPSCSPAKYIQGVDHYLEENAHLLVFLEHLEQHALQDGSSIWKEIKHSREIKDQMNDIRHLPVSNNVCYETEYNPLSKPPRLESRYETLMETSYQLEEKMNFIRKSQQSHTNDGSLQMDSPNLQESVVSFLNRIINSTTSSSSEEGKVYIFQEMAKALVRIIDTPINKSINNSVIHEDILNGFEFITSLIEKFNKTIKKSDPDKDLPALWFIQDLYNKPDKLPDNWPTLLTLAAQLYSLLFQKIDFIFSGCGNKRALLVSGGTPQDYLSESSSLGYLSENGAQYCSATLISQQHAITAAHCLKSNMTLTLRTPDSILISQDNNPSIPHMSQSQENTYKIEAFKGHPLYYKDHHDIAVLKLDRIATNHTPICLTTDRSQLESITYHFAGWGDGSGQQLNNISMRYYDYNECNSLATKSNNSGLDSNQFCLKGTFANASPCKGDSGGPAIAEIESTFFALGVLGGGFDDCQYTNLNRYNATPTYFTLISPYIPWILRQIVEL